MHSYFFSEIKKRGKRVADFEQRMKQKQGRLGRVWHSDTKLEFMRVNRVFYIAKISSIKGGKNEKEKC